MNIGVAAPCPDSVPVIPLDSPGDPLLADYACVADPALARSRNLFVAEGRLVVRRLVEDGRHPVHSVLVSEAAARDLDDALRRLDPGVPVHVCPLEWFRSITGFNIHRGCLALAVRPAPRAPEDLLHSARLVVALDTIVNADNVGGLFRNAAAFGADAVVLNAATCDPLYRKAIRTSMGAALRLPFASLEWPAGIAALRAAGLTVVALTPRADAEPLDRFARGRRGARLALLVGNEGEGLQEAASAAADVRVRIPIRRDVDSLNVAVAAGIALSQLTPFADVW